MQQWYRPAGHDISTILGRMSIDPLLCPLLLPWSTLNLHWRCRFPNVEQETAEQRP